MSEDEKTTPTLPNTDVIVVIQARYGSTRLPGKILLPLDGKPLIQHTIERARKAKRVDHVILATSTNPENDVVATLCKQLDTPCYRGSEEDVLERFIKAVEAYTPRLVVRICGDEPLLDPKLIDEAVKQHDAAKVEYSTSIGALPTGLDMELINYETLQRVAKKATTPAEREHVTKHIVNHPETFTSQRLDFGSELARPDIILTVDTRDDYEYVQELAKTLAKKQQAMNAKNIIRLVDEGSVRRRPGIILRADAGHDRGIGDVQTLRHLATRLKREYRLVFAMTKESNEALKQQLRAKSYEVLELDKNDTIAQLETYCKRNNFHHAITHFYPNDNAHLARLARFLKLLVIDYHGALNVKADFILSWDVNAEENEYQTPPETKLLLGPGYAPIPDSVTRHERLDDQAEKIMTLTVTFGGADPQGLTSQVAKRLQEQMDAEEKDWHVTLIRGPAYNEDDSLSTYEKDERFMILDAPRNIHEVLAKSDLVICNGGFTTFELCTLGTPFIGTSTLPWEDARLQTLAQRGACKRLDPARLADELDKALDALATKKARTEQARTAHELVDGKGVERITKKIRERWTP